MRKIKQEEKIESIEVTKEAQINDEIILEAGDRVQVIQEKLDADDYMRLISDNTLLNMTEDDYRFLRTIGFESFDHRFRQGNPRDMFAEKVLETNTLEDIKEMTQHTFFKMKSFFQPRPDQGDLQTWGISEEEWKQAVIMAIEKGMFYYEDSVGMY